MTIKFQLPCDSTMTPEKHRFYCEYLIEDLKSETKVKMHYENNALQLEAENADALLFISMVKIYQRGFNCALKLEQKNF